MASTNQPPQQVNIQLGEKEAEGTYANLAIISHSAAEFIFDFTRVLPGVPKTKVYSRIIMTPQHTKSLLKALQDNIGKYEAQFGEIKIISEPARTQPIGFQATTNPPTETRTDQD
ncbi:DUF3467 domain-containing protein [candidate division KSB1 bacterium]|nr:DUF3467 domain-containing protein [candidate division KSB1 bacterium]RQW05010.1 MAG: DUF3467 domain-containing protein [candidate division KSB1 bacterium]